jgi:hypothetical protein
MAVVHPGPFRSISSIIALYAATVAQASTPAPPGMEWSRVDSRWSTLTFNASAPSPFDFSTFDLPSGHQARRHRMALARHPKRPAHARGVAETDPGKPLANLPGMNPLAIHLCVFAS